MRPVVKLPDNVWDVVAKHAVSVGVDPTADFRQLVEQTADIVLFDGGAFIAVGNEFDLFVVDEKRGKWRIRSEIQKYLDQMAHNHDTITVRINQNNSVSLRLARHFGFEEVGREFQDGQDIVRLEKRDG